MIENGLKDKNSDVTDSGGLELLTPENTSNMCTATGLWALAKMVNDMGGDPICELLMEHIFENLKYGVELSHKIS